MSAPGPRALGRGVIVTAGDPVPAAWDGAEVVTVDEGVLADPGAAVAALHRAWASRMPVVVALAVDPGRFRAPRSYADDEIGPTWLLPPGFTPEHDRLHFLVWANTYDAREPGEPVWWWARKAARLGAGPAPAGAEGDVVLPTGEVVWVDGGPRGDAPGVHPRARRVRGRGPPHPGPAGGDADVGPGARPAGGRDPRLRAGPGHRPGRVGEDPGAHRAPAPPGGRPGLRARLGRGRGVQPQGPRRDGGPHHRRRGTHPHAQRPRLRHRGGRAGPPARGARGAGRAPPAGAAGAAGRPPAQHRPAGPLRGGAVGGAPRPARPAGGRGRAGRRAGPGRGVPGLPRRPGVAGGHRLRRAGAAGHRAAAAGRRVPPRPAGPAPPPAGGRVPGPDPGARPAGPAAGGPGVRRVRRGRRRPGHLRPRGRDAAVPHRVRRLLPRGRRARPGGQLPLPAGCGRRRPPPAHPQPGAGAEDDPGGRPARRRPGASRSGATLPRRGRPSWWRSCRSGWPSPRRPRPTSRC